LESLASCSPLCECQTPMLRSDQTKGNEMRDMTMTYAEWYQTIEKPRLEAITPEHRALNSYSHVIGNVDECSACIYCECKSWNTWKMLCPDAPERKVSA
jgi:hypothetical protein